MDKLDLTAMKALVKFVIGILGGGVAVATLAAPKAQIIFKHATWRWSLCEQFVSVSKIFSKGVKPTVWVDDRSNKLYGGRKFSQAHW